MVSATYLRITRGTPTALRLVMYDFETINAEQLVTRTDVVLRGDLSKRRAAARARGTVNCSVAARYAAVRRELLSAGAHEERTMLVRQSPKTRARYCICAVATIAWCCVAAVCLHL
jgi:hypothetical protein